MAQAEANIKKATTIENISRGQSGYREAARETTIISDHQAWKKMFCVLEWEMWRLDA